MKIYEIKNGSTLTCVALSEVVSAVMTFAEAADALHSVEVTLKNGRLVDMQMSLDQWDLFRAEWETAL